jgi:hypothetical protein
LVGRTDTIREVCYLFGSSVSESESLAYCKPCNYNYLRDIHYLSLE